MEFGDFNLWLMPRLKIRRPGGLLASDTLNMLGAGLPYALGVKGAFPEARVVLLSGDGAFGYYPAEIDTAVRNGLPVVAVVGNDAAWGIEQHFQRAIYGEDRLVGTSLLATRYDLLTEVLGGHGEYVGQLEELEPALERAFASNKPACVNVAIRQDASPLTMAAASRFRQ